MADEFYTIREVAIIMRVSRDTVRRLINEKALEAVKIRGQWRIYTSSVEAYMKRK